MASLTEDAASEETQVTPKTSSVADDFVVQSISRDDYGRDFWRHFRVPKEKQRERQSIYWCTKKGHVQKRPFVDLRHHPIFDTSSWTLIPKANKNNMPPKKCHLLSLPKELRLLIWSYVLTDPSLPRATLEIDRAPKAPSKTSLRFPHPCIRTTIQPARNTSISIDILATNDFIYREALPILYHSVTFAALDLQGIFMPFLSTLSSFAHSHIRFVKLRIPNAIYETDPLSPCSQPMLLVNWAITCAQVAKIENLREVKIEGYTPFFLVKRIRDGILKPLLKIKAKKSFSPEVDAEAQEALREAEKVLADQAELRSRRTLYEAAEHAPKELHNEARLQKAKEDSLDAIRIQMLTPRTLEAQIGRDNRDVSGLRQFEQELQEHENSNTAVEEEPLGEVDLDLGEWEVVVLDSGDDIAKGSGSENGQNTDDEDAWTDAASTLVETKSRELFVQLDMI
ncbi:hypothetical protein BU23DRAFT_245995 [Bimuria novae-zelandiae CBS 107.79]|uniref:DUF7730 domain-containing protein n=1 Tax=Bimuria novae-zelandiae CBS 107.79 TaxID=1447943 RepID=A0A6A5UWF5_9PLEO|nr:hypothetical protein BU23DRAFT_245995 [Bimuria novae-zelandiae CBS 107.79]